MMGVGGSGSRIHGRIHDLPRVLFPGFNLSTTQILTQFASNTGHGQLVPQVKWSPRSNGTPGQMVPTVIKHPGYPSLRVLMWPSYHHHDYEHFQHKIMPISSEHNHHCHPHQHDVVLFRTEEAVQQTAAVLSQLVALTGGRKVDIMIIIIIMLKLLS